MTSIEITNTHTGQSWRATYSKAGALKKIEAVRKSGGWHILWSVLPVRLADVDHCRKKFPDVSYQLQDKSPKSMYKDYVNAWFDFFKKLNGIAPKFGATDGAAIKAIMRYLESVSESPEVALATWQAILGNWHKLDDFYRKSPDLKFINSQLNKIITNLKDATTKTANHSNADDLRQRFK